MGWACGYSSKWERDVGYGVPALCDHPRCGKRIHRGLAYVCGDEPDGGEAGCGLFFCDEHRFHGDVGLCRRCFDCKGPFRPSPDLAEWIAHKLSDETWAKWREENPEFVAKHGGRP